MVGKPRERQDVFRIRDRRESASLGAGQRLRIGNGRWADRLGHRRIEQVGISQG